MASNASLRLHERFAASGSASVHFGWLVRSGRLVVVKRRHPHVLDDGDETELRFAHPNVVPTLGVIRRPGEHLAVIEWVPGASVAELADAAGGPIDPRVACAIAAGALRGLEAAHALPGPRDVSPASILVATDGAARVIGFDLPGPHTAHTIVDKLPYASPEQLLHGELDARRNVYAVSVMLWELLTGRRLFRARTVEGTLRMILSDSAVAAPSRFAPWIAPAVDAVVLRGLARDPSLRFPSPLEMAHALERVPVAAAAPIAHWLAAIDLPYMRRRNAIASAVTTRERSRLHTECSARASKM